MECLLYDKHSSVNTVYISKENKDFAFKTLTVCKESRFGIHVLFNSRAHTISQ